MDKSYYSFWYCIKLSKVRITCHCIAGLADGVWVWKQSHGDAAWAEFENAQYVDIPETPREHKQYKNASEMELILRMPEF